MLNVDQSAKAELLQRLETWHDADKPLVEAIGDTLARWQRVDSQEQARRVVDTSMDVFDHEL
jgi:hypothetical protein